MNSFQSRPLRVFWLIVKNETLILVRDGTLPLVCVVLALMVGCGLFVGMSHATLRGGMVAEVVGHEQETQAKNEKTLRSVLADDEALVPFSNPANPAALAGGLSDRHAVLPNAPLAALAVGQSDMMPNYYSITYLSKVHFMYDTEIENPWNLLSGHFDLDFLIVFVLPLLIIGLGYNLLSAEREQGTLRMLCSQPLSLTTLVAGKLAVRIAAILAIIVVLPLVVLLVLRPESRSADPFLLLSWSVLVACYVLFWFSVAALVNVAGLSSSSNALILVATWTVLVLILPVALNLAVNTISPVPSRTELASRTRVVTADSLRQFENLFSADYRYASDPESLRVKNGHIEVPSRMRAFFLAKQNVDEQIEPLLKRFDQKLLEQQKLVDTIGFLSPAILINEALSAIAGTDTRRFLAFKAQTEGFHNSWRQYFAPRIRNDRATSMDDLNQLPRWDWIEVPVSETIWRIWSRIGLMFALVLIVGAGTFTLSGRRTIV
jgi:ABC-2 type transport system permease protein